MIPWLSFALVGTSGCGSVLLSDARPQYVNVGPVDGGVIPDPPSVHEEMAPSVRAIPANEFISNWRDGAGVDLGRWGLGTVCGFPVTINSSLGETAYGNLIVFRHRPGSGPGARGDYLVEISDDRIASAGEGRLAVQYESYLGELDPAFGRAPGTTAEHYAWVMLIADRPLMCPYRGVSPAMSTNFPTGGGAAPAPGAAPPRDPFPEGGEAGDTPANAEGGGDSPSDEFDRQFFGDEAEGGN